MQLLFLLSFSALVSFFQGDFLVPDLSQMPPPKTSDAALCLGVKVRVKVFLEGPYVASSSLMTDNLRTNNGAAANGSQSLIPTSQPYNITGFSYTGTESCNASVFVSDDVNNAIVDWILIELRHKTTGALIETRAALLQKDGDVVETDGTNPDVTFSNATACDDYHIAVRHRNHLGVRTASVVILGASSGATVVDLSILAVDGTDSRQAITFNGNAQKALSAGDTDASKSVISTDRDNTWNDRNLTGYRQSDCDMNGVVSSTDRDITWNSRNKTSSY